MNHNSNVIVILTSHCGEYQIIQLQEIQLLQSVAILEFTFQEKRGRGKKKEKEKKRLSPMYWL